MRNQQLAVAMSPVIEKYSKVSKGLEFAHFSTLDERQAAFDSAVAEPFHQEQNAVRVSLGLPPLEYGRG